MMKTQSRNLAIILFLVVVGCSPEPESLPTEGPTAPSEITVRVKLWDKTTRTFAGVRAEIWMQGHGPWFFDLSLGDIGYVNDLGKKPVNVEQELYIYPDGRNGTEIVYAFLLTPEMCPDGCDRDSILVSIYDDRVDVISAAGVEGTSSTFIRN